MAMTLDDVDRLAVELGCRRATRDGRATWLVDGRLVVREDEPGTLCVRVDFADRERLAADHPDTLGIPPRWEKHMKMQALLDGDPSVVRAAVEAAVALQRGQSSRS